MTVKLIFIVEREWRLLYLLIAHTWTHTGPWRHSDTMVLAGSEAIDGEWCWGKRRAEYEGGRLEGEQGGGIDGDEPWLLIGGGFCLIRSLIVLLWSPSINPFLAPLSSRCCQDSPVGLSAHSPVFPTPLPLPSLFCVVFIYLLFYFHKASLTLSTQSHTTSPEAWWETFLYKAKGWSVSEVTRSQTGTVRWIRGSGAAARSIRDVRLSRTGVRFRRRGFMWTRWWRWRSVRT